MPHSPQELLRRYHQLRHVLERAYAQPAWNSHRIDRIADALTETERTLCRFCGWRGPVQDNAEPSPVDNGVRQIA